MDDSLPPLHVAAGTAPVALSAGIVLKGAGLARARVLDDARNALKFAQNARDYFRETMPEQATRIGQRHATFAPTFGKRVLTWHKQLQRSAIAGQAVQDTYQRIYLLEWAGARVAPSAGVPAPVGLAKAPQTPATPDLAGYLAYVDALVAAIP